MTRCAVRVGGGSVEGWDLAAGGGSVGRDVTVEGVVVKRATQA